MSKIGKILLYGILGILVILAVGPFLVPVPPLEDTLPPEQLADPDSRFADINGIQVHYKGAGAGEPTIILLHGFGASTFSWREVIDPLADIGTVYAYDRPAFGLTERPLTWEQGNNPYSPEAQVEILIGLMDNLEIDQAVLVGNSAGGTVSLNAALAYPDRVKGLVLVDAAVYQGGGAPALFRPLLGLPQLDHLGPLLARQISSRGDDFITSAWSNPALITDEILQEYRKPLQAENWDLALWELTKASRESNLESNLGSIMVPALVVSGEDDQIVPLEYSLRLAEDLPNAALVIFPDCGHLPQEECPALFMDALKQFVSEEVK